MGPHAVARPGQARTQRHLFGITGYPTDPAKVDVPRIWYEEPVYYKCNRFAVVGSGAVMVEGKMQDDASWKQCKVMVDLARLIAEKDPELKALYGF